MSQGIRGRKRVRGEETIASDTMNSFSATPDSEQIVEKEFKPKRARTSLAKATATPVEGDCTICFENYKNDYAILRCNHTYCFKCIQEWSETENSCPLCKGRFTYMDRYTVNPNEEGKKPKKQRVKVGKKDQRESYLRHAIHQQQHQQHQHGGAGIRSFSFFPLGNSVIGRQFLMNLIHTLHPHATFDDEDEEDDDDWFPPHMDNFSDDDDFSHPFASFRAPTTGPGTDSNDPINLVDDEDEEIYGDSFSTSRNHRPNPSGSNNSLPFSSSLVDPFEEFIQSMPYRSNPRWRTPASLSRNSTLSSRRSEPELVDLTCDDEPVNVPVVSNNASSSNSAPLVPEISRLATVASTAGTCTSTEDTHSSSNSNSNSSSSSSNTGMDNNSRSSSGGSSVPDSLDTTNGEPFPLSGISMTQTDKEDSKDVATSDIHSKILLKEDDEEEEDMGELGVRLGRSNVMREYQRRRQRPRQIPAIYDDFEEF